MKIKFYLLAFILLATSLAASLYYLANQDGKGAIFIGSFAAAITLFNHFTYRKKKLKNQ